MFLKEILLNFKVFVCAYTLVVDTVVITGIVAFILLDSKLGF